MKILNSFLILLILIGCTDKQQNLRVKMDENRTMLNDNSVEEYDNPMNVKDFKKIEPTIGKRQTQKREQVEALPSFEESEKKDFKTSTSAIKKQNIVVKGKNVKVNIESIPLNKFIDFIFSSVLKLNYSVDKKVKVLKQPITLNMSEAVSKQSLFNVVEKILKKESVTLTKDNGTIFISLNSSQAIKNDLSNKYIFFGRKIPSHINDDEKVMIFVPYQYTNPKHAFKILRRLGTGYHVTFSYIKGNIQILDGKARDVRQTLEMISVIDSLGIEKKSPYLITLENIDVKKFKRELLTIFKSNAIPIATSINEVGIVLTEIKELNALLVLTPKKSWLDRVLFWKDKLDRPSEVDTEHRQLYSYKVKYRKADDLAAVLSDVLTGVDMENSRIKNRENNQSNVTLKSESTSINIKSDLYTNTLMMNITPNQYKKILPTIKKLDTLPLEVMLEVTLAEVTMTNNFSLGFEWALLNNKAITGTSTQVSGAHSLDFGGSGIVSTLFTKNLTSIINSFAEQKKLEILSQPRLVILNNKTGTINVGKQVPVVNSESTASDLGTSTNSSILRNIKYITTGMTVKLTPTINSNGSLSLDISVQLSEAQTNSTSNIDSPLIVNRALTTSAVMQSGNSILLGGIISHNKSNGAGGVPLLKDLPLIGDVFKSRSDSHVKTELIIVIKPKILKNNLELSEETQKFKLLLKNLRKSIIL